MGLPPGPIKRCLQAIGPPEGGCQYQEQSRVNSAKNRLQMRKAPNRAFVCRKRPTFCAASERNELSEDVEWKKTEGELHEKRKSDDALTC